MGTRTLIPDAAWAIWLVEYIILLCLCRPVSRRLGYIPKCYSTIGESQPEYFMIKHKPGKVMGGAYQVELRPTYTPQYDMDNHFKSTEITQTRIA